MEMNEYQKRAMTTCMESSNNVAYMWLNLLGEVGELAEKMGDAITAKSWKKMMARVAKELAPMGAIAKELRKEPDTMPAYECRSAFERVKFVSADELDAIVKEMGDIMWQTAGLAKVLGVSLEAVAGENLDKLASRQERNQIDGDGDER